MMRRINPNSSLRKGYSFEDLYVLKLCLDWLKEPDTFKEIRIQFIPEEISSRGFALDDVVAIGKDGKCDFCQLKHKQNPHKDLWTFDELLDKGLLRWIESFEKITGKNYRTGSLITNGHPSSEVQSVIEDDKISFDQLTDSQPAIVARLELKFSRQLLKNFFSAFQFRFSHPTLDDFEKNIRNSFYQELKVTKEGVNNLLLHIVAQGADTHPEPLTLTVIRELLSWDNPRPLNQNFDVPDDFEFFDKATHQSLLLKLANPAGGIQVIIGKPGTGKSTYLSKLFDELKNKMGVAVARHHYHLNPKDASFRERLNAERVKEALKAEFKKHKEEVLGELTHQNTEHVNLSEFITRISQYYYNQSKTFVLIIDGLDHVLREGKSKEELREFLDEVLYPQPGFFILLGTQEMSVPYFPNVIHHHCQRDKWIEIKGLKKQAVERIVLRYKSELGLTRFKELNSEVINKIFEKTSGNPLHLRYVISELKNRGGTVYDTDVDLIVPYKTEIREYYEDLWRQLPQVARSICFAIALLDFKIHEEEVFELGYYLTRYSAEIEHGYISIRHLIRNDLHGISVYHNSFLVFLLEQEELQRGKKALYRQIRAWLRESGNEELKWSELVKIEYYLGNTKPLMAIDRKWVIDNFLLCRNGDQIEKLLGLAVEASFNKHDYEKVTYYRTLQFYFSNRHHNLYSTENKIWQTAFGFVKHKYSAYPDFSRLNHSQITEILITLKEQGRIHLLPDEAVDRFNELLTDRDYERDEVIRSWIRLLAAFDSKTVHDAYKFIVQFRKDKSSPGYFREYCARLLNDGKHPQILALVAKKLSSDEQLSVAEILAWDDLIHNANTWRKLVKKLVPVARSSEFVRFYHLIAGEKFLGLQKLHPTDQFPHQVDFRSTRSEKLFLYTDNFFTALFLAMSGKDQPVKDWIHSADKRWPVQLSAITMKVALYLAECLALTKKCSLPKVLSHFDELSPLDFYDDHDIYELRSSYLPFLIKTCLQLQTAVNCKNGVNAQLSDKELILLSENIWLYKNDITELISSERIFLSDKAFTALRTRQMNELSQQMIPFKDRAERMIELAQQAKAVSKLKDAKLLLQAAAENIIAYGNHKDILLYSILRSIEICVEGGSKKSNKCLREIARYIYNICELTDGDETSSFIYNYGQLLSKTDKNLFYNLYFDAVNKRNYNLSEILFADLLDTLDLSDELHRAIAGTAVDHNSYTTLERLSKEDKHAKQILGTIQQVLGTIDYSRGDETETRARTAQEKDEYAKIYKTISPPDLADHLEMIKGGNYYHRRNLQCQFLLGWAKHWLSKKKSAHSQIISCLQKTIEPIFEHIDEKVLDYIYPFVITVNREFAFKCLVWAHANSSSWSDEYIRPMTESRERWMKAVKDFPDRKVDFFEQSISCSGKHYGYTDPSYYIPIPKSTQYFVDCGDLKKAEKVTESAIKSLPLLFPGIEWKEPEFITKEKVIPVFDILMTRLHSISPLVRERAAHELSGLLQRDRSGLIHQLFLNAITKISLESLLCEAILVLIHSLQNPDSFSYTHVTLTEFVNQLSAYGKSIELLLMRLAEDLDQPLEIDVPFVLAIRHENPFLEEDKFLKKLGTYLPLAYRDYLDRLQMNAPFDLWKVWCNLYEDSCKDLNIQETRDDQDYCNDRRQYMTGRSTVFTDILKSTFLKLLDFLKEMWLIDYNDLFYYTVKNFPVDASVWNLRMDKKPDWWPGFSNIPADKNLNAVYLKKPLADLFATRQGYRLLHLSGIITPVEKHYEDILDGTINVIPIGFRKKGSETSDPKTLYNSIIDETGFWCPLLSNYLKFQLFENKLKHLSESNFLNINDFEILPLVSGILMPGTHLWQYYRWCHHFRLLNPTMADSLTLKTEQRLTYWKDRKLIARISDFADGVRDRAQFQRVIPAGNYISIELNYLQKFLEEKELSLAYVIKQEYSIRDYSFDDKKKTETSYDLVDINGNPLV